jgi:hypothetical protein
VSVCFRNSDGFPAVTVPIAFVVVKYIDVGGLPADQNRGNFLLIDDLLDTRHLRDSSSSFSFIVRDGYLAIPTLLYC